MFSRQEIEGLLRKALAALIGGLLVFALLAALLIAGLVLVLWAITAGLTPYIGQAGALAVSGGLCFLALGLFFWRLISARVTSSSEEGERSPTLRERIENTIRDNPLEAALGAFALGLFGQADARFRALVLQSGVAFMRQAKAESAAASADPAGVEPGEGMPLGGEP